MGKISNIEKGAFLNLFNRNGFVLDFSTIDFDSFTLESVGIALCNKYQMSKGKSLQSYLKDASEEDVIKLLSDLLLHYELYFQKEIAGSSEYSSLYLKCKEILDRIRLNTIPLNSSVDNLKEKFSSEYIDSQIELMMKMQKDYPTEAIGKAKELIESCCKTILEYKSITIDKNWDILKLVGETTKLLKVTPKDIPETIPEAKAIKAILGNLKAIAANVAELRNSYGSGHGKSASYKGLEERHAKLAVGSSVTLVHFLWDSFDRVSK